MVLIETVNLISVLLAMVATGFLFVITKNTDRDLKKGFMFLAIGTLIAIGLHSFAEFLEAMEQIDADFLLQIMPVLVLIGSAFFIIGAYYLYRTILGVSNGSEKQKEVKK